jgi:uncharacterized protein
LWRLRRSVDPRVFRDFGIASVAGGLVGALLQGRFVAPGLSVVFGILLLLSGAAGFTRWPQRVRLHGLAATLAGGFSGLLGGLVGNQGSVRSAALLSSGLPPDRFVATATATALVVDAARLPVYLVNSGGSLGPYVPLIGVLTVGVLIGTLGGERVLRALPEPAFRVIVATLLMVLGVFMVLQAF